MASPSPHQSASSVNLPIALSEFKLQAPQIIKGGRQQFIPLLKRPEITSQESEESVSILSTWDEWWSKTSWANNPSNIKPRWNSTTRTGYVWTQVREAAHVYTGHPHVYCLNCGIVLQHPNVKAMGTKHLLNHLKAQTCTSTTIPVHSNRPTLSLQQQQQQVQLQKQALATIPAFSQPAFERELVQLVIDNNWSFRTVERPSFQRFLQFLRPETVITSRYKFGLIFQHQFKIAKAGILQNLEKDTKLSIALDGWTASNHLSFLAVKGYYINKSWHLEEVLLDFIPMRGRHTGSSMAREVLEVLKKTGTTHKLLAITCDNASNNSTLSRYIQSEFEKEDYIWSSRENTIPCLAHIINLVVQDIIFHLKLSASADAELGETLQRQHVQEVQTDMSVPNSLRKVSSYLSQTFIAD